MLEAFDYLAKRDTIKTVVKKKAQFVLNLFCEELEGAKSEFENMKSNAIIPFIHGKYSGQSIIVRQLVHRIETLK